MPQISKTPWMFFYEDDNPRFSRGPKNPAEAIIDFEMQKKHFVRWIRSRANVSIYNVAPLKDPLFDALISGHAKIIDLSGDNVLPDIQNGDS